MSTHAHEYGFPSSHSTNSVTIALFFAHFIWERQDSLGSLSYGLYMLLAVYAISVVGGRLYTGMHSTGMLCSSRRTLTV
jgi:membrane-associated phospholipid phosphatase